MWKELLEGNPIVCGMVALVTILLAAAIHSFFSESKANTKANSSSDGIIKKDDNVFDMDGDWGDEANNVDVKKTLKERVEEAPKLVMDNPKEPSSVGLVKPKINSGPFKIGQRIVLQELLKEEGDDLSKYNGRHGHIADVWDGTTYPIDLDLPLSSKPTTATTTDDDKTTNNNNKPLRIKVANLREEGELINIPDPPGRIAVNSGCLPEDHGRICAFLFKTLRSVAEGVIHNNPQKKKKFAETAAEKKSPFVCWQFWKDDVYPAYLEFMTRGILLKAKLADLEQSINPGKPKGTYKTVVDAVKSKHAVASWNVRVEGQFYLVGMGPEGTMVIPVNNLRQVYCVVGYQKPLGALLGNQMPRPPKVQLTLLPWYGRIIHDTLVSSTSGTNQIELASPPLARQLAASCQAAISEGRIIYRLAQLEVENGSTEGVPFEKPVFTPPPQQQQQPPPDFSKEPTATQEERGAVENLTELTAFHPKTPLSAWNIVRLPNNNKPMINILQGQGQKLHEVELTSDYTALFILKTVLTLSVSKLNGHRPLMIGVDDVIVCQRLRFLCQGISNLKIAFLKVERKEQAPAAGAAQ
mmetsp:Transcript_20395/g.30269  ORF Transcript_20395/g.30269 Transcript_20395/m.30269 type:complete len:582 (+) Transcript_20395:39-1784(+)